MSTQADTMRRDYKEQGFVVVPGILNPHEIERYKVRARKLALGDAPEHAGKVVVKDVRVAKGLYTPDDPELGIWKLLQPDWYDDVFAEYPATPALLDVVEALVGPDIKAFLTMLIYKPPGVEALHPYHQDSFYFQFGPHDRVLGSWVPLDHAHAGNGTLAVIPGSHRLDLLEHRTPEGDTVNFGVFGAKGYEQPHPDEIVLDLQPGDGVFFHSRLLHRTGPNLTPGHRRVMTVHFASATCRPDGEILPHLKFRLVRGREHEGCI